MDPPKLPQHMTEVLGKFEGIADEIIKTFGEGIVAEPPPSTIYHYTNDVGLRGILDTGQFWLTDIFSLNDPSELSHGVSHAVEILNGMAATGPPESRIFAERFADFHATGIPKILNAFICAFSARGNELGQWQAYADNGRGYALGFDAKVLEGAFVKSEGKPKENNMTFPVYYESDVLSKTHHRFIEEVFDLISLPYQKKWGKEFLNDYMKHLAVSLSVRVLRVAPFFKHEAYENEAEYRFFELYPSDRPPPVVKQRVRSYELVKYREFDWRRLAAGALRKIVIGPAADRTKATRFVKDCSSVSHTGCVEIEYSGIPYRAV